MSPPTAAVVQPEYCWAITANGTPTAHLFNELQTALIVLLRLRRVIDGNANFRHEELVKACVFAHALHRVLDLVVIYADAVAVASLHEFWPQNTGLDLFLQALFRNPLRIERGDEPFGRQVELRRHGAEFIDEIRFREFHLVLIGFENLQLLLNELGKHLLLELRQRLPGDAAA